MKDLSVLWKPATGVKPKSLINRHLRHKVSKRPLSPTQVTLLDGVYCMLIKDPIPFEDIEYLDESPEAIREMFPDADKWANETLLRMTGYAPYSDWNGISRKDLTMILSKCFSEALTSNPNEHTGK